jgi:hypothetical protein
MSDIADIEVDVDAHLWAKLGQPGEGKKEGQQEQDRQNKTAMTGLPG